MAIFLAGYQLFSVRFTDDYRTLSPYTFARRCGTSAVYLPQLAHSTSRPPSNWT